MEESISVDMDKCLRVDFEFPLLKSITNINPPSMRRIIMTNHETQEQGFCELIFEIIFWC